MSNGITLAEETEQRLRWENQWLREQWQITLSDCQKWRRLAEDQSYYLAVVSPPLAELAEDDHFRRFRESA